ncbi:MAG: hypothetical protein ACYC9J_10895 [Sulfuricaulis sp.]
MLSERKNILGSKAKTWLLVIGFVLAIVIAFVIGESKGQRAMLAVTQVKLDGVQAMLTFNRLDEERLLKSWLSKGCVVQAQSELDFDEDQDTRLLAEFFQGKLDPSDRKYVSDRDPKLVASLNTFKSKYGTRWEVPKCK